MLTSFDILVRRRNRYLDFHLTNWENADIRVPNVFFLRSHTTISVEWVQMHDCFLHAVSIVILYLTLIKLAFLEQPARD